MQYNDEKILNINDYEAIAKAYASALSERGFKIIQVEDYFNSSLVQDVLEIIYEIKSCLFCLGGFLNTGEFYSLNERHIKKLVSLFDAQSLNISFHPPRDKTKCLLEFLSLECKLIRQLINLSENSNYERQIKDIIESRLNKLSEILSPQLKI